MNIFVTDSNPRISARHLCDAHVVKMVTESAQMLSTAHRVLDGILETRPSDSGKTNINYWKLPDDREDILYKAVYVKHPCNIWVMSSKLNYKWLWDHYDELSKEYTYRYGKNHGGFYNKNIGNTLEAPPINIKMMHQTPFAIAMKNFPECIVENDPVASYRNYYKSVKSKFARWTKREVPDWYELKIL